jgi:hypothetical protein
VIKRHEKLFGNRPEVLAADKGFCPAEEKFNQLAQQLATLAIPRRMQDFADKVLAHWQAFRAGIEGTISGLKRAFRLVRCFFKGFQYCPVITRIMSTGYSGHFQDLGKKPWKVPEK